MENKGQNTASRLMVSRVLTEEKVSHYMQRLFNEKPHVFIHSINVAYLVAEIAYSMGYEIHEDYDDLVRGALLHDIGKLQVPDSILLKPGKLDPDEWEIMKNHSSMGYDMIKDDPYFSDLVKDIVLHHHEKLNGSGYPDSLEAYHIAQEVQIVTVCDIYDALTEKRCYGRVYSASEALRIMNQEPINTTFSNMIERCSDK